MSESEILNLNAGLPAGRGKNGGARLGAGRKKQVVKFASENELACAKISEKLPQLLDSMLTLCQTHTEIGYTKDGTPYEMTVKPDRQAIEYLLNRLLGKPTETMRGGIEATRPINVQIITYGNGDFKIGKKL